MNSLLRLWTAYNFIPTLPDKAPARLLYPMLLERMKKPTFVMDHGSLGVEFCNYYPEDCPFGLEYCRCKDFWDELPEKEA